MKADPGYSDFSAFMKVVDERLNQKAQENPILFENTAGKQIENIICEFVSKCAEGTEFEGTIKPTREYRFPDIVAANHYGIEVKSTKENKWTSIGRSILESRREDNVERIYLTFAKLGNSIEFKSRPYEECMADIEVTHYPRYRINMNLEEEQTIFSKMKISYEELRSQDNPAAVVANYYKKQLRPGEHLWWAGGDADSASPMTMKIWSQMPINEKNKLAPKCFAYFPEAILSNKSSKYDGVVFWLLRTQSIVVSNIRDLYSSGGKGEMMTMEGNSVSMPAVFRKIKKNFELFKDALYETPSNSLSDFWKEPIQESRADQWIKLVLSFSNAPDRNEIFMSVLQRLFKDNGLI